MAQSKRQKAMMIKLHRFKDFEGDNVKIAVANKDESIIGTLIQSRDFADEMEIRVTTPTDKFAIRGHKSAMQNLTPEQVADKVVSHIETRKLLDRKKS